MTDPHRKRVCVGAAIALTVLVDGEVRGTWVITRRRSAATLTVELFDRLSGNDRIALAEEGMRLLTFAAAEADDHDLRIIPAREAERPPREAERDSPPKPRR